MKLERPRWARSVALLTGILLLASACSSGSSSDDSGGSIKGQHITVMVPPWARLSKSMLAQFEKESGVTVDLNVTSWDGIRDKVAVAGAANTPLADVVELDWSWTGQFGRAGWFAPLQDKLSSSLQSDLQNSGAFTQGGNVYGVCYSNDFRISAYNKAYFAKAGIQTPSETLDQLANDLQAVKQSGAAQYPLALPLSATEGTATAWYLLTLALGGQLFDDSFKPLFASPDSAGYKALQFEVDALNNGLVSPGSISMTDSQADERFTSGAAAVTLASGPDELVTANDPKSSSIVNQAAFMLVPGENGPGGTFGLPEGLGIMSTSEHQAAALAFIEWWMKPSNLLKIQSDLGLLPCRTSVVHQLVQQGKLVGGQTIEKQLQSVQPLFPQGAPPWYTRFSTEAATLINAAAKGSMSVGEALNKLASDSQALAGG
jgi:multiple sugar transport system substrate-binding protein